LIFSETRQLKIETKSLKGEHARVKIQVRRSDALCCILSAW